MENNENLSSPFSVQKRILGAIGGDETKFYDSPYSVLRAILEQIESGGGNVPEAPKDGSIYGRKDGDWAKISASFEAVVVDELPTASAETMGKMYLVPSEDPEEANVRDEYISILLNDVYSWEKIGSTAIDLTGYYTKDETDDLLDDKQDVLIAGNNISIDSSNIISASFDTSALATKDALVEVENVTAVALNNLHNDKQDKLTAGQGITIDASNIISASFDTSALVTKVELEEDEDIVAETIRLLNENKQDKLTAGQGITIDASNVISASGGAGITVVDYADVDYSMISDAPESFAINLYNNIYYYDNNSTSGHYKYSHTYIYDTGIEYNVLDISSGGKAANDVVIYPITPANTYGNEVRQIWKGTQDEYDALSTYDNSVLYVITEDNSLITQTNPGGDPGDAR